MKTLGLKIAWITIFHAVATGQVASSYLDGCSKRTDIFKLEPENDDINYDDASTANFDNLRNEIYLNNDEIFERDENDVIKINAVNKEIVNDDFVDMKYGIYHHPKNNTYEFFIPGDVLDGKGNNLDTSPPAKKSYVFNIPKFEDGTPSAFDLHYGNDIFNCHDKNYSSTETSGKISDSKDKGFKIQYFEDKQDDNCKRQYVFQIPPEITASSNDVFEQNYEIMQDNLEKNNDIVSILCRDKDKQKIHEVNALNLNQIEFFDDDNDMTMIEDGKRVSQCYKNRYTTSSTSAKPDFDIKKYFKNNRLKTDNKVKINHDIVNEVPENKEFFDDGNDMTMIRDDKITGKCYINDYNTSGTSAKPDKIKNFRKIDDRIKTDNEIKTYDNINEIPEYEGMRAMNNAVNSKDYKPENSESTITFNPMKGCYECIFPKVHLPCETTTINFNDMHESFTRDNNCKKQNNVSPENGKACNSQTQPAKISTDDADDLGVKDLETNYIFLIPDDQINKQKAKVDLKPSGVICTSENDIMNDDCMYPALDSNRSTDSFNIEIPENTKIVHFKPKTTAYNNIINNKNSIQDNVLKCSAEISSHNDDNGVTILNPNVCDCGAKQFVFDATNNEKDVHPKGTESVEPANTVSLYLNYPVRIKEPVMSENIFTETASPKIETCDMKNPYLDRNIHENVLQDIPSSTRYPHKTKLLPTYARKVIPALKNGPQINTIIINKPSRRTLPNECTVDDTHFEIKIPPVPVEDPELWYNLSKKPTNEISFELIKPAKILPLLQEAFSTKPIFPNGKDYIRIPASPATTWENSKINSVNAIPISSKKTNLDVKTSSVPKPKIIPLFIDIPASNIEKPSKFNQIFSLQNSYLPYNGIVSSISKPVSLVVQENTNDVNLNSFPSDNNSYFTPSLTKPQSVLSGLPNYVQSINNMPISKLPFINSEKIPVISPGTNPCETKPASTKLEPDVSIIKTPSGTVINNDLPSFKTVLQQPKSLNNVSNILPSSKPSSIFSTPLSIKNNNVVEPITTTPSIYNTFTSKHSALPLSATKINAVSPSHVYTPQCNINMLPSYLPITSFTSTETHPTESFINIGPSKSVPISISVNLSKSTSLSPTETLPSHVSDPSLSTPLIPIIDTTENVCPAKAIFFSVNPCKSDHSSTSSPAMQDPKINKSSSSSIPCTKPMKHLSASPEIPTLSSCHVPCVTDETCTTLFVSQPTLVSSYSPETPTYLEPCLDSKLPVTPCSILKNIPNNPLSSSTATTPTISNYVPSLPSLSHSYVPTRNTLSPWSSITTPTTSYSIVQPTLSNSVSYLAPHTKEIQSPYTTTLLSNSACTTPSFSFLTSTPFSPCSVTSTATPLTTHEFSKTTSPSSVSKPTLQEPFFVTPTLYKLNSITTRIPFSPEPFSNVSPLGPCSVLTPITINPCTALSLTSPNSNSVPPRSPPNPSSLIRSYSEPLCTSPPCPLLPLTRPNPSSISPFSSDVTPSSLSFSNLTPIHVIAPLTSSSLSPLPTSPNPYYIPTPPSSSSAFKKSILNNPCSDPLTPTLVTPCAKPASIKLSSLVAPNSPSSYSTPILCTSLKPFSVPKSTQPRFNSAFTHTPSYQVVPQTDPSNILLPTSSVIPTLLANPITRVSLTSPISIGTNSDFAANPHSNTKYIPKSIYHQNFTPARSYPNEITNSIYPNLSVPITKSPFSPYTSTKQSPAIPELKNTAPSNFYSYSKPTFAEDYPYSTPVVADVNPDINAIPTWNYSPSTLGTGKIYPCKIFPSYVRQNAVIPIATSTYPGIKNIPLMASLGAKSVLNNQYTPAYERPVFEKASPSLSPYFENNSYLQFAPKCTPLQCLPISYYPNNKPTLSQPLIPLSLHRTISPSSIKPLPKTSINRIVPTIENGRRSKPNGKMLPKTSLIGLKSEPTSYKPEKIITVSPATMNTIPEYTVLCKTPTKAPFSISNPSKDYIKPQSPCPKNNLNYLHLNNIPHRAKPSQSGQVLESSPSYFNQYSFVYPLSPVKFIDASPLNVNSQLSSNTVTPFSLNAFSADPKQLVSYNRSILPYSLATNYESDPLLSTYLCNNKPIFISKTASVEPVNLYPTNNIVKTSPSFYPLKMQEESSLFSIPTISEISNRSTSTLVAKPSNCCRINQNTPCDYVPKSTFSNPLTSYPIEIGEPASVPNKPNVLPFSLLPPPLECTLEAPTFKTLDSSIPSSTNTPSDMIPSNVDSNGLMTLISLPITSIIKPSAYRPQSISQTPIHSNFNNIVLNFPSSLPITSNIRPFTTHKPLAVPQTPVLSSNSISLPVFSKTPKKCFPSQLFYKTSSSSTNPFISASMPYMTQTSTANFAPTNIFQYQESSMKPTFSRPRVFSPTHLFDSIASPLTPTAHNLTPTTRLYDTISSNKMPVKLVNVPSTPMPMIQCKTIPQPMNKHIPSMTPIPITDKYNAVVNALPINIPITSMNPLPITNKYNEVINSLQSSKFKVTDPLNLFSHKTPVQSFESTTVPITLAKSAFTPVFTSQGSPSNFDKYQSNCAQTFNSYLNKPLPEASYSNVAIPRTNTGSALNYIPLDLDVIPLPIAASLSTLPNSLISANSPIQSSYNIDPTLTTISTEPLLASFTPLHNSNYSNTSYPSTTSSIYARSSTLPPNLYPSLALIDSGMAKNSNSEKSTEPLNLVNRLNSVDLKEFPTFDQSNTFTPIPNTITKKTNPYSLVSNIDFKTISTNNICRPIQIQGSNCQYLSNVLKLNINKILSAESLKNIDSLDNLTIPLNDLGVIKYVPDKLNEFRVKTSHPSIELKAWPSKIKLIKPKLVLEATDYDVVNFLPVVRHEKFDFNMVQDIAKETVEKNYGRPIVLKGVYNDVNSFAVVDDIRSLCGDKCLILWPTYYDSKNMII